MKILHALGLLAATATTMAILPAVPAMADTTVTTFDLTGGSLTLSTQGTATLTTAAAGTTNITGDLGAVSVTDARGGTTAWSVTADSTVFTGALATPSSSTAVNYTAGVVTESGTITVADGAKTLVDAGPAAVVAPSALSGNNTAAWTPALDVTMPAGALTDTYSGTVTTSIA